MLNANAVRGGHKWSKVSCNQRRLTALRGAHVVRDVELEHMVAGTDAVSWIRNFREECEGSECRFAVLCGSAQRCLLSVCWSLTRAGLFGWLLSLVLASSPAPGIEETLPRVNSRASSCSGGLVDGMGEQAADSDKSSRRLVGGMGEQVADSDKSSRRLLRRIGSADWRADCRQ
jgi:hypothetical protein